MNILVTGSAGFIGHHLVKKLTDMGHKVLGIDNLNNYYDVKLKNDRLKILKSFKNFKFKKKDIMNFNSLSKIFKIYKFDIIINLAAQAGVRDSINKLSPMSKSVKPRRRSSTVSDKDVSSSMGSISKDSPSSFLEPLSLSVGTPGILLLRASLCRPFALSTILQSLDSVLFNSLGSLIVSSFMSIIACVTIDPSVALDSFDCHFQGKFIFNNEKDVDDAKKMGISDLNRKYELNEIVKGDSIFCATAITDTMNLNGVVAEDSHYYLTETLVTHKDSNNNFSNIVKKRIKFDQISN